jgi:hypothetical protein
VWRGGRGRQVAIARLLPGLDTEPLDEALGRRAGALMGQSRTTDAIDAALVCLTDDGDLVLTSDVGGFRLLSETTGTHIELIPV